MWQHGTLQCVRAIRRPQCDKCTLSLACSDHTIHCKMIIDYAKKRRIRISIEKLS